MINESHSVISCQPIKVKEGHHIRMLGSLSFFHLQFAMFFVIYLILKSYYKCIKYTIKSKWSKLYNSRNDLHYVIVSWMKSVAKHRIEPVRSWIKRTRINITTLLHIILFFYHSFMLFIYLYDSNLHKI